MNLDYKQRDIIIFGFEKDWSKSIGGTLHFEGLSKDKLQELVNKGFADPKECQNSSPSIQEFLQIGEISNKVTFHGYLVSPDRQDYRASIEGIDADDLTVDELLLLIKEVHYADEFDFDKEKGSIRAWWD